MLSNCLGSLPGELLLRLVELCCSLLPLALQVSHSLLVLPANLQARSICQKHHIKELHIVTVTGRAETARRLRRPAQTSAVLCLRKALHLSMTATIGSDLHTRIRGGNEISQQACIQL